MPRNVFAARVLAENCRRKRPPTTIFHMAKIWPRSVSPQNFPVSHPCFSSLRDTFAPHVLRPAASHVSIARPAAQPPVSPVPWFILPRFGDREPHRFGNTTVAPGAFPMGYVTAPVCRTCKNSANTDVPHQCPRHDAVQTNERGKSRSHATTTLR